MSTDSQILSRELQTPTLYGVNVLDSIAGDYLPISGGIMQGEIDMNGYKITNLGQNSLQAGDAVNLQTLQSYFNQSRQIPSTTLSARYNSETLTSAGDILIVPGILAGNRSTYQNQTNWEDIFDGLTIDGVRLGSNNVIGLPTSATLKVSFRFNLSHSTTFTASVKLRVQDLRTGLVVAETDLPIPPNSSDTFEMSLPVPYSDFSLADFDNFIVSMILSVDQPVIVMSRLLALQYIFSY
jgi:hypothetical protein